MRKENQSNCPLRILLYGKTNVRHWHNWDDQVHVTDTTETSRYTSLTQLSLARTRHEHNWEFYVTGNKVAACSEPLVHVSSFPESVEGKDQSQGDCDTADDGKRGDSSLLVWKEIYTMYRS